MSCGKDLFLLKAYEDAGAALDQVNVKAFAQVGGGPLRAEGIDAEHLAVFNQRKKARDEAFLAWRTHLRQAFEKPR